MKDIKQLTGKQKGVLDFINTFLRENGYSPSLKEIAAFIETENLSTAQYYVEELEKKGHLKRNSNKARGITLVINRTSVPLLGFIAAGKPIEPIENPEEIEVPNNIELDSNYPHYALRVKGKSMFDMGILDGDIVLIKHQLTASKGDVVVGITEDGATLKVLNYENGKAVLEPRNKDYEIIRPNQLEIRGKFVGLIRNA
jgi:repressor LexA